MVHQCTNPFLSFPVQPVTLTLGRCLKALCRQVNMFNSAQTVARRTRETIACMNCRRNRSKVVLPALFKLPDIVLNIALSSVTSLLMVVVSLALAIHVQEKGSIAYMLPFNLYSKRAQTLSRTMACPQPMKLTL